MFGQKSLGVLGAKLPLYFTLRGNSRLSEHMSLIEALIVQNSFACSGTLCISLYTEDVEKPLREEIQRNQLIEFTN